MNVLKRSHWPLMFVIAMLLDISCNSRRESLSKQGNIIINKVETYKKRNGIPPSHLSQLGINEKEEGPFYYERLDSLRYIIWYGNSLGESITYHSDTKKWENSDR